MKFKLIDYHDVWGNAKDGYEVNNLAVVEEDIYISDDASKDDILRLLKRIGYLKKSLRHCDIEVWDNFDMIELFRKRDMYPICRLESIEN